jgi:hypothetical protein
MKALIYFLLVIGLLSTCKNVEVFKPTCTNVVLEKVDWTYCHPIYLTKCGNGKDTLTRKTIDIINNATGIVKYDINSGYCIVFNYLSGKLSVTAYNLPDCFRKDGIKIKFSGIVKETHVDLACGNPMELTKLEEIP